LARLAASSGEWSGEKRRRELSALVETAGVECGRSQGGLSPPSH
jgi:hypothetical protein